MSTYRCKLCGFRGPSALVNRHIALTHKAATQPACKVCGDAAEVWATRSHKTAYCNTHSNRYGLCRWCGHPRQTGWGSAVTACACARSGYFREGAIDSPVAPETPPVEEDALAGTRRFMAEKRTKMAAAREAWRAHIGVAG
jgi:predicted RNA-binding Zn-ribbon protein involved in translation (DUF1610 family)